MQRRSNRALVRSADLPTTRGTAVRLPPMLQGDEGEERFRQAVSAQGAKIVLDLFCGAGGLSYGFQEAGFVIAVGVDSDADACATHAANFLSRSVHGDIAAIESPEDLVDNLGIPRVDVIVGGPPCQGFSHVGRAKVRSLSKEIQAEISARNYLYREFVRFVGSLRPLFFVMENVPHLSSFADGVIADQIRADFSGLGYQVYHAVLDASLYGVPQSRQRLFFIGSRVGWVLTKLPRPTHGNSVPVRTLADAIADLPPVPAPFLQDTMEYVARSRPDLGVSGDYAALMRSKMPPEQAHLLFDHVVRPVRDDDAEIFRSMPPGGRYVDVDPRYHRYEIKVGADGDRHFADRYYRLRWDRPCGTITAHMAKDGYRYIYPDNDQLRTLSVREAARIQSFPDHFRFAGFRSGRFRQIGNAVPPLLAEAIARVLAHLIENHRRGQLAEHEWQPPLPLFPATSPITVLRSTGS